MKLLDDLNYGWAFPKRAKKAHYFNKTEAEKDISACGKYSIRWSNGKAYLPVNAFWNANNELCQKCLNSYKIDKQID